MGDGTEPLTEEQWGLSFERHWVGNDIVIREGDGMRLTITADIDAAGVVALLDMLKRYAGA